MRRVMLLMESLQGGTRWIRVNHPQVSRKCRKAGSYVRRREDDGSAATQEWVSLSCRGLMTVADLSGAEVGVVGQ